MSAYRPQARKVVAKTNESLASAEERGRAVVLHRRPETALQALMETASGQVPEESSEERLAALGELSDRMAAALAALAPNLHEAFIEHHLNSRSFAEVGRLLGVSKATAERWEKQAKAQLAALLMEES